MIVIASTEKMQAVYVIFAFFALFFTTADAVGEHEVYINAVSKCATDHGLNETFVIDISTKLEVTTEDSNARCFFKCFLEEMQWMDNKNCISGEGPYHDLDEMTIKFVKDCAASTKDEDNACDKAYFFNRCILEKRSEQK